MEAEGTTRPSMLVKISEVREDSGWTQPNPLGLMAPDLPWPLSWSLIPSSDLWSGRQSFLHLGVAGMNGLSLLYVLGRVVTVQWSLQGTCRV